MLGYGRAVRRSVAHAERGFDRAEEPLQLDRTRVDVEQRLESPEYGPRLHEPGITRIEIFVGNISAHVPLASTTNDSMGLLCKVNLVAGSLHGLNVLSTVGLQNVARSAADD